MRLPRFLVRRIEAWVESKARVEWASPSGATLDSATSLLGRNGFATRFHLVEDWPGGDRWLLRRAEPGERFVLVFAGSREACMERAVRDGLV